MKKYLTLLLLFFAVALLFAAQAQTSRGIQKVESPEIGPDQRYALLIGNAKYKDISPLRNPVNDARAMSSTLRELGFNVELLVDASKRKMKKAIDRFGKQLMQGGFGLFYYSGHGMQVEGHNYLIPVDAKISGESDIEYESVNAGRVLGKMKDAKNFMNLVILDACRNNPYVSSYKSINPGLATLNAPSGTLIAYATAPGMIALDGKGSNGLYTRALLHHIKTPGLKLEEVFKKVRADVQTNSKGNQVPWEASSLIGEFYFVPPLKTSDSAQEIAKLEKDLKILSEQKEKELEAEKQKLAIIKRQLVEARERLEEEKKLISTNEQRGKRGSVYIVKLNDSLSIIAQRYSISVKDLAKQNGINNINLLEVGQKLIIPHNETKPKTFSKSKNNIPNKNGEESQGILGATKKLWSDITDTIREINKKKWHDNAKEPDIKKTPIKPIKPSQIELKESSREDISSQKVEKQNYSKPLDLPLIKLPEISHPTLERLPTLLELPKISQPTLERLPTISAVKPATETADKAEPKLEELFPEGIKLKESVQNLEIPEQASIGKKKDEIQQLTAKLETEEYNLHIRTQIIPKLGNYPAELFARIRIKINASGNIFDYEFITKSGSPSFDKAAELAVRNAVLDPLPQSLAKNPPYIVLIRVVP